MDRNQLNQISAKVEAISGFDLDSIFEGQNKDEFNSIFTFKQSKKLHLKVVKSFKKAIESEYLLHLPYFFISSTGAQINLIDTLNNYLDSLEGEDLKGIDRDLNDLCGFLLQTGLFNILQQGSKGESLEDLNVLKQENEIIKSFLRKKEEEYENLLKKVNNLKETLENYLEEKHEQYAEIPKTLEQIQQIKINVEETQKKIDQLNISASQKYSNINEVDDEVTAIQEVLSKHQSDYENNLKHFKEVIAGFDQDKQRATEVRDLLNNLISPAVAENLHRSFDSKSQKNSSPKWIWLSLSIVCLGWIAYYLAAFIEENTLTTTDILVYIVRTLPFVFVSAFGLKQYSNHVRKEDQYDFRSAMSLSLDAYLRMLDDRDLENINSDRNELIKRTVEKIYASPFERDERRNWFQRRNLKEALELLKEVKNLKN